MGIARASAYRPGDWRVFTGALLVLIVIAASITAKVLYDRNQQQLLQNAERLTIQMVDEGSVAALFPSDGLHVNRNQEILSAAYERCRHRVKPGEMPPRRFPGYAQDDVPDLEPEDYLQGTMPHLTDSELAPRALARAKALDAVLDESGLCDRWLK